MGRHSRDKKKKKNASGYLERMPMVTIKSQGTVDKNKVKIPHIIAFCTTKTNAESYYDYFFSRVIMIKMG